MWKIVPRFSHKIFNWNIVSKQNVLQHRYFMSNSFSLQDVWDSRIKSPILSKIDVDDMYYELENQFNHFASASALDIDLFANSVISENNIDEVEDIVHKLRLSPEAVNILASTHHAFIRLFLQFGNTDELLRVLNDRLNYGIFPDDYCLILMMDKFLKENNFKDAAKVAVLQMLQEDFSNPVVKYMALYSCLKYLENPTPWIPIVEENIKEDNNNDEDDEEVKVRVKYIRNPYFDDHFDLVDPYHLIGKTLTMIGNEMFDDYGRTIQLIGNGLYNKWDCLKSLIESNLNSNKKELLFRDGLTLLQSHLNNLSSKERINGDELSEIKEMLSRLETSGHFTQGNLLKSIEDELKKVIHERELVEIQNQSKMYDEWEVLRGKLLQEQINKLTKEKQLAEIKAEKQKLKEKEEELFFFENENTLDLVIENKFKPPTRTYPGKKKKPRVVDEVYVPPEIRKVA